MNKEKAEESRERGNACMKKGSPTEAFFYYTEAIKWNPTDPRLYSNRSLSFLQIDQHYHALEDAKKAIKLNPNWPKGHFRKGEVEMSTGHYQEAVCSYQAAVSLDDKDPKLKEALEKAKEEYRKLKSAEFRIPVIGTTIGFMVGVLIVLADHYLTAKPSLQPLALKLIFLVIFALMGFGASWTYFFIQNTYREALLQPPTDFSDKKDDKKATDDKKAKDAKSTEGSRKTPQRKENDGKTSTETRQRRKKEKT
ncbi:dnaJ homolog subfamily C member 7-like [Asterias amurensis]|uniref:dnaJ homolog subfamily C member 7-like n=1 Tax=Asterias amurensis TaxID=7602 RepID=UPI003AB823AE